MSAARCGLADEYGRLALLISSSGSIPVGDMMRRLLGIDSLMISFRLTDDDTQGPNEKFEMVCLHRGARAHARILAHLATIEFKSA